jgi:carboxyl-terminal processing protease
LSYNAKLKVTTAKYYIPSGRCIQALDYSHRNEDGSVGVIPDSLISEFYTKNKRKVYDGGGVAPDITLQEEELSNLTISLIRQFKIFDFATRFRYENASIPSTDRFVINDAIYSSFIKYVSESNFDYTSETEAILKELKETAKNEKYLEFADKEIAALEAKLAHNLERDLVEFRDEIASILKDEIVSRYYYQTGAIKSSLEKDQAIARAMEVLNDEQLYRTILTKGYPN